MIRTRANFLASWTINGKTVVKGNKKWNFSCNWTNN